MNNISYLRAGVSCVPVIGPFVGLYNMLEVHQSIASYRGHMHATGEPNPLLLSRASQNGRTYSACAIVGNVLTLALIVGLVAFGILSGSGIMATIAITSGTTLAYLHGLDYLTHNRGSYIADTHDRVHAR